MRDPRTVQYGIVKSKKGFFIGDVSYALTSDMLEQWGTQNCKQGCVKLKVKSAEPYNEFISADTYFGDGLYRYSESDSMEPGKPYKDKRLPGALPVDGGNIGVVPLELCGDWELDTIDESALGMIYKCTNQSEAYLFRDTLGVFNIKLTLCNDPKDPAKEIYIQIKTAFIDYQDVIK